MVVRDVLRVNRRQANFGLLSGREWCVIGDPVSRNVVCFTAARVDQSRRLDMPESMNPLHVNSKILKKRSLISGVQLANDEIYMFRDCSVSSAQNRFSVPMHQHRNVAAQHRSSALGRLINDSKTSQNRNRQMRRLPRLARTGSKTSRLCYTSACRRSSRRVPCGFVQCKGIELLRATGYP